MRLHWDSVEIHFKSSKIRAARNQTLWNLMQSISEHCRETHSDWKTHSHSNPIKTHLDFIRLVQTLFKHSFIFRRGIKTLEGRSLLPFFSLIHYWHIIHLIFKTKLQAPNTKSTPTVYCGIIENDCKRVHCTEVHISLCTFYRDPFNTSHSSP